MVKIIIKNTPVSPFLLVGNHIYYGDEGRNLIKFSIVKKIPIWKYKFPKLLILKPKFKKKLIVASVEDNNTYFITARGGLKYWYRSTAGRLFAPVSMGDHIAEVLRTESGTIVNFYGIGQKSFTQFFNEKIKLKFPPVFLNKDIYSIISDKEGTGKVLIKIGNKFGSIIKTEPLKKFETGKAIRINVKIVNIFKPDIKVEIFDSQKNKQLSKNILYGEQRSIAWIPSTGGRFTLKVSTKDENNVVRIDTKEIFVSNPLKLFRELQKKLHKNCEYQKKNRKNEEKNSRTIFDKK